MASDHLVVAISPVLLEALSIPGDEEDVDYYRFLGVNSQNLTEEAVDAAVLERTRELRRWQNSPQHGEEAVKLLPFLHRVAKILKDPVRQEAYAKELDGFRRGDVGDPIEDFRDMVRAALADGTIENRSKAELLRYAQQHGIDQAEAGRILSEYSTASAVQPGPESDGDTLFQIREGGAEEFRSNLKSLLAQGRLTQTAGEKAIAAAGTFSIEPEQAESILYEVKINHFRHLVERVADGGTISNNQARLLMPKAKNLGIKPEAAYEVISDFTFTGASQDDLSDMSLVSAGFDASEIDDLLNRHETVVYRPQKPGLGQSLASAVKILVPLLLLAGLALGVVWGWGALMSSGPEVAAEPTPTPSPSPTPAGPWKPPLPDPESGFLLFEALEPGDPAAFQAKIQEVSSREYRRFLIANLHPNRPTGWGLDYSFPEGFDGRPVVGISAEDAREYCAWRAKKLGLEPSQVRLPTVAEYRRMLRARNPDGLHPLEEGFWDKAGLSGQVSRDVRTTRSDTLLFSRGQIYDLLSNVEEWATDETGRVVTVGGSIYTQGDSFDPEAPRSVADGSPENTVGFRIVISPPATFQ